MASAMKQNEHGHRYSSYNWGIDCRPAAFDLSVLSLLKPDISDVGHTAGTAAAATKTWQA